MRQDIEERIIYLRELMMYPENGKIKRQSGREREDRQEMKKVKEQGREKSAHQELLVDLRCFVNMVHHDEIILYRV